MNTEKRDFDKEAAAWDESTRRVKLAQDVADTISKSISLTSEMNVMDFGCGTGLVTMQLEPLVGSITGVDSSQKMLDMFNEKIAEKKLNKIKTLLLDLDSGDTLTGSYDLIFSNMTLHHIKEIEPLLKQFYNIIAPGGVLCIADLDLDNGKFHNDNTGVFHFGFDRDFMRKSFKAAGFDNIKDIDAAKVVKPIENGETSRFSVFLIIGER